MPRTKAPKKASVARATAELGNELLLQLKEELLLNRDENKQMYETMYADIIKEVKQHLHLMMLQVKDPQMTLAELRNQNSTLGRTFAKQLTNESVIKTMHTSTSRSKKRRSRSFDASAKDDDGYITGSSLSSTASTRHSRSRSKAEMRTTRTRSLSRNKSRGLLNPMLTNFVTPANKVLPNAYAMVTPKMRPNAPQVVLRRPKQGEVAISLEGSPLMVNSVQSDNTANINIPLKDGRLICIQPERGIRMSTFPILDDETAQQLLRLEENIQKIRAHAKRVA